MVLKNLAGGNLSDFSNRSFNSRERIKKKMSYHTPLVFVHGGRADI